jgi:hypothetical protein
MMDVYQRQAIMYDWLGNGMESARRRIAADTIENDSDKRFVDMCERVFEPTNTEWSSSGGRWGWANDYLYDAYPKAKEYFSSHYEYRFEDGNSSWRIVDTETLSRIDTLIREQIEKEKNK